MGQDDPLYRTIERIVHRIIDGFGDNLAIFDELRAELEAFLLTEEQAAEANFATTAEAINEGDRKDLAGVVAKSEIERRVESYPIPRFLADFLRQKWQGTLEGIYLREGEDSDAWSSSVATLEDLVWSVQPKKTPEDRKHLVALLPSLLKRLAAGVPGQHWGPGEREAFMANLVEAHAAAVKPSLASVAVADCGGRRSGEGAKPRWPRRRATRKRPRARKRSPPRWRRPSLPRPNRARGARRRVSRDRAQHGPRHVGRVRGRRRPALLRQARLDQPAARQLPVHQSPGAARAVDDGRGCWPSSSAANRARLVEAEPLIDRAFTRVISELTDRFELETVVRLSGASRAIAGALRRALPILVTARIIGLALLPLLIAAIVWICDRGDRRGNR